MTILRAIGMLVVLGGGIVLTTVLTGAAGELGTALPLRVAGFAVGAALSGTPTSIRGTGSSRLRGRAPGAAITESHRPTATHSGLGDRRQRATMFESRVVALVSPPYCAR